MLFRLLRPASQIIAASILILLFAAALTAALLLAHFMTGRGSPLASAVVLFVASGAIALRLFRDYGRGLVPVAGVDDRPEGEAGSVRTAQACRDPGA